VELSASLRDDFVQTLKICGVGDGLLGVLLFHIGEFCTQPSNITAS